MTALSQETIARIRELAAAGVGRNEIARELGVSVGSVTAHAPAGAFDRSATLAAVKARQADMAERRAILAEKFLGDMERLREQLWQPTKIYSFGGKDNTYNEKQVDEPPFDAKRNIVQAVSILNTAHLRLVDHDGDSGLDDAKSVLDGFMDAVAQKAAEINADSD